MTILYSAIAKGTKVLCHHQEPTGTCYDSVISSILPNIPVGATARTSYTTNSKICVNVLVDKGLTFICICSEDTGKSVPFELLNQLNKKIHETSIPIRALNCGENEFDREFGPTLVSMAERFNSNLNSNGLSSGGGQLSTLQNQVDEVKGVMIRNIEAVLEREQKLEDLVAKSSDLEAHASSFQKTATRVKRKMWWRNTRMMIALGLAVVIAVIILILIILFSSGILPVHTDATTTTATTTTTTTTTTTHLP